MSQSNAYKLVKVLSNAEYKKVLSIIRSNKQSKHLYSLFKFIRESESYESLKDKSSLSDIIQKNYHQYSLRLSNIITSSLRSIHCDNDIERLIISLILDINIYIEKEAPDLAFKSIKKVNQLINDYGLVEFKPVVHMYYSNYLLFLDYNTMLEEDILDPKNITETNKSIEAILKHKSSTINVKKNIDTNDYEKDMSYLLEVLDNDIEEKKSPRKARRIIMNQVYSNGITAYTQNNFSVCQKYFYAITRAFNEDESYDYTVTEIGMFISACLNLLDVIVWTYDLSQFKKIIKTLNSCFAIHKNQIQTSEIEDSKLYIDSRFLHFYMTIGDLSKAEEYLKLLDKKCGYKSWETKKLTSISLYFLNIKDFDSALNYINKAFSNMDNDSNDKHYYKTKVIELLIYSEMGDYDYCENLIRSFTRSKWNIGSEKEIDKIFCQCLKENALNKMSDVNPEFYATRLKLLSDIENSESYFKNIFNLRTWIESRAKSVDFIELSGSKFNAEELVMVQESN